MRKATAAPPAENRWTLAFGIMMMLLFALFLALYSVTKKEAAHLRSENEEFRAAKPKEVQSERQTDSHGSDPARISAESNGALQSQILEDAKSFLSVDANRSGNQKGSDVEVLDLASGDFVVRISAPDLFSAGSSKITPAMRPFVNRLGALILKAGRRLRIEGHADFDDSEAIQRKASSFLNTWELSAARSAALAQYWMKKFDFDPLKIEVGGFGKYRPLEKSLDRPPQANRRIEVVILRSESASK